MLQDKLNSGCNFTPNRRTLCEEKDCGLLCGDGQLEAVLQELII